MPNYKRIYEQGYSYFITIVTHKRNPVLTKNISLLKAAFKQAKTKYAFIIEAVVVLPDHIHMIITPQDAREYPKIIRSIKEYFSKRCDPSFYSHLTQSPSREKRGNKPVWQKRYYEHTIRDEKDFKTRLDYIHYNPVKHGFVQRAKDWKYSSFDKFVKKGWYDENWCDFSEDVDFE